MKSKSCLLKRFLFSTSCLRGSKRTASSNSETGKLLD